MSAKEDIDLAAAIGEIEAQRNDFANKYARAIGRIKKLQDQLERAQVQLREIGKPIEAEPEG